LKSNLSQLTTPPYSSVIGPFSYFKRPPPKSSGMYKSLYAIQKASRSANCTCLGAYALVARMKFAGC
jgi:hypothetical protein